MQENTLSQCLGLGYIASYLKLSGHDVEIIDALAEGMDSITSVSVNGQELLYRGLAYEAIIEKIRRDTELIGISIPFTNLSGIAKNLCVLIRKHFPGVPIVAGGVHPSTLPYNMLDENIDYIVRGEGEIPMSEIALGKDPRKIKGLVFRAGSEIIDNGISQQIDNLDQIPFPFRPAHLIDKYLNFSQRGQQGKRTLSIVTSRGCPYDCNFCSVHPVSGYRWRARTPQNVVEEIKSYINNYDINHIEFEDDNITLDPERAEKVFDAISALNKKITWAVDNGLRVDTLSERLLNKMKQSGCIQVNLAIESGNQETLSLMNKKLSLNKAEEVVSFCAKVKIATLGFFLIGYPGETKESFLKTAMFVKRLRRKGLQKIGAMIVNAYPGTELYNYCKQKGYLAKDIDSHIFVDDNYVSITTEDFDQPLVISWRDSLEGLFHPFRWRLKQIAKIILSTTVFKKLTSFYLRKHTDVPKETVLKFRQA